MANPTVPTDVADIWQQAADKVAQLRRDDLAGESCESWNGAIERASQVLAKEATDIRQMAHMAHLLIVGNVSHPPTKEPERDPDNR